MKNWWTPRKLSSSRIKGARAHSPGMAIGKSFRVIGQAELAQVILAKEVWKQRREQRNGGFFLDDDAARYELAKVCSPVEACMNIVKVIAKVDLASQARAWYDRVSTESNTGDTASGSNPESVLRSSPGAKSPSSKPCGIHEAPGGVVCVVVRYVYVLGRESFGDLSFKASRLREVVQDIDLWSMHPSQSERTEGPSPRKDRVRAVAPSQTKGRQESRARLGRKHEGRMRGKGAWACPSCNPAGEDPTVSPLLRKKAAAGHAGYK